MSNVKSRFISKPETGRRLAISDIHGCSKTFKKLLKKVELTQLDHLFLIGDYVNKGPSSDKVLNKINKLRKKGYNVHLILGNHEQIILNCIKKSTGQRKRILNSLNSLCLLENKNIKTEYVELFKSAVHFIETEKDYLVHAGFSNSKNFRNDPSSMLRIRNMKYRKKLYDNKRIIIGHSPTPIADIKQSSKNKTKILCIDGGCVNDGNSLGKLICLNLDSGKIISKKFSD